MSRNNNARGFGRNNDHGFESKGYESGSDAPRSRANSQSYRNDYNEGPRGGRGRGRGRGSGNFGNGNRMSGRGGQCLVLGRNIPLSKPSMFAFFDSDSANNGIQEWERAGFRVPEP